MNLEKDFRTQTTPSTWKAKEVEDCGFKNIDLEHNVWTTPETENTFFYVLLCGGNFEVPILYLTCQQKDGSIAINRKVKVVTEKVQFWLFVFTEKQTKERQINEVGGWKRNTLPLVYTLLISSKSC